MLKTLYYSLKIDIYYAINSLIYYLRKVPIFKDLFTDDAYKSSILKYIFGFIGIVLSTCRAVIYRLLYFLVIYLISRYISDDSNSFYHVFFFFSIIGMFINNKLLNTSLKKYLSIVIFNMDSKKYLKFNLFWSLLSNFIFNSLCFLIFSKNITISLLLVLLQLCLRVIGEGFNIWYYREKGNFWYENTILYFVILITLLLCSLSPFIGLIITKDIIIISLIISFFISIISYLYIMSFNDYKYIYKRLNTMNNVLSDTEEDKRLNIVKVNNKDIKIDNSKLIGKSGYDYFNTIFFERHKSILLTSSINYSLVLLVIYGVFIYLSITSNSMALNINNFLNNRLAWFVLIMYFINRGSIVTQAMFYNCDHAMLNYNFYREPKVIIGLFKMRLFTIIKVNLIPSFVIGIGNIILLFLTGGASIINYIGSFLFIIILSVFFSVHYLVIYYLLQPFDKSMKIKKISYSIVNLVVYFVSYMLSSFVMNSITFSIYGLIISIAYILIGLKLVSKYAPLTFKIN